MSFAVIVQVFYTSPIEYDLSNPGLRELIENYVMMHAAMVT